MIIRISSGGPFCILRTNQSQHHLWQFRSGTAWKRIVTILSWRSWNEIRSAMPFRRPFFTITSSINMARSVAWSPKKCRYSRASSLCISSTDSIALLEHTKPQSNHAPLALSRLLARTYCDTIPSDTVHVFVAISLKWQESGQRSSRIGQRRSCSGQGTRSRHMPVWQVVPLLLPPARRPAEYRRRQNGNCGGIPARGVMLQGVQQLTLQFSSSLSALCRLAVRVRAHMCMRVSV